MNFNTFKKRIAELEKKLDDGESIQVNVKGRDETGENQYIQLRVNKESTIKISTSSRTKFSSIENRIYRSDIREEITNIEFFDLDLTSIDVTDAEVKKIIEEASHQTKQEIDKLKKQDSQIASKDAMNATRNEEHAYQTFTNNLPLVALTIRPEDKLWEIYEECRYKPDCDTHTLIVPKGYKTDLASVPRIFWAIISSFELSLAAPVFHDLIYQCAGELLEGTVEPFPRQKFERSEADNLFLELMTKANVPRWKREVAYYAVYYGAWWAWKKREF